MPQQVLTLPVRVDLGVIAMKGYSTFLKSPLQEPHNQIYLKLYPGHLFSLNLQQTSSQRVTQPQQPGLKMLCYWFIYCKINKEKVEPTVNDLIP